MEQTIKKPKLTIQQQIEYMRDERGILFNITNEQAAYEYLKANNYYFKVKSFEKNYSIYHSGENKGKYCKLEFAYLQELAALDMHLRKYVLNLCLDVEHFLKVTILYDISCNDQEDGYTVVKKFLSTQPSVEQSIQDKKQNAYNESLIDKYAGNYAAWNLVEILSFGDLISFCEYYYAFYPNKAIPLSNLRTVKFIRNASAHNTCLINNLSDNSGNGFKQNRSVNQFLSTIQSINDRSKCKKMGNRAVHDFVVLLYTFSILCSKRAKDQQIQQLEDLLNIRFKQKSEYFEDNMLLVSNYEFIKKLLTN